MVSLRKILKAIKRFFSKLILKLRKKVAPKPIPPKITAKPTLLEVWKDFKPYVYGGSRHGLYKALFEIVPVQPKTPVTLEMLEDYVHELAVRYPERQFYGDIITIEGRKYFVMGQATTKKDGSRVKDRLNIYFLLNDRYEVESVFIPKSSLERQRRLTNYLLMRTLGKLGMCRSKYVRMIGKAD